MQSPDWETLAAEMIQHGFVQVLHLELSCPKTCGDFRLAILTDSEFRPICPRCGKICEAAVLARGLCRCRSFEARCVSPVLPDSLKAYKEPAVLEARRWHGRKRMPAFYAAIELELKSPPTNLKTRIREPEPAPQPRPHSPRPTRDEMGRRIVLLAELLLRRESQETIARTLGLSESHLRVTIFRRRADIENVMKTLQPKSMTSDALAEEIGATAGSTRACLA